MPKIEQLRVWDFSNPATIIYKINELIDAVNKLQELARCAESSLARQSKDIDMLSETQADIEESMKNMNDTMQRYIKIENSGPTSTETEEATQIDNNSIKEAKDMLEKKWADEIDNQAQRYAPIQTVDNQTARHESYSPHLIRSTATDTNVGTKRTPLDDLVDEIDDLYPIEEERQISIRKQALKKILERYFMC